MQLRKDLGNVLREDHQNFLTFLAEVVITPIGAITLKEEDKPPKEEEALLVKNIQEDLVAGEQDQSQMMTRVQ